MNKNIEETVELSQELWCDYYRCGDYTEDEVKEILRNKIKSLIKSGDNRYTQKDLCNAYKKGHDDGVMNKPVLDEFSEFDHGGGER